MGRSSRNEIRHHRAGGPARLARVHVHTYVFVDTYVRRRTRRLSCTSRRDVSLFSIAGSIIMCAPLHPSRSLAGRVSPSSLSSFFFLSLSLSRPQMKMFGQISGRAQSETPTQIFSVSAESRAITMGPHKSWRSGWSGCTAGSDLAR